MPPLNVPALAVTGAGATLALASGEPRAVSGREARDLIESGEVLLCHAPFVAARLRARLARPLFDAMELFAFVRPGERCLPSPLGLAHALSLGDASSPVDLARVLHKAVAILFDAMAAWPAEEKERARKTASAMARAGWRWGPLVVGLLGEPERMASPLAGFDAWRSLPQWEDEAPLERPTQQPVAAQEALARLQTLVSSQGTARRQQQDFTAASIQAFAARDSAGAPKIALVEAGTGTGKTLGYLAPASLWAEKNGPGLWISTFTRNLQRQIFQEIARLYPDPKRRDEMAVLRKGRENYLCLLNFEEAVKRLALAPGQRSVALGLIARWIKATADGDLSSAGFPAFLAASIALRELTDRRGECVYAACPHYRSCFIERGLRRARRAPIVIANHALVMAQATRDGVGGEDPSDASPERTLRYVFDEGHHLFDAADSAFSADLSGAEMAELRRWLRGPEGRASRARGLNERVRELLVDDAAGQAALEEVIAASSVLAGDGWLARIKGGGVRGPGESFLALAHNHVRARSGDDADSPYSIEAETKPLSAELIAAAQLLNRGLLRLIAPLNRVAAALRARLDKEAAELESSMRARLEGAVRGIERRAKVVLPAWRSMLATLDDGAPATEFADWFEIARDDGRDVDVGLKRHWIDPTIPFAEMVLKPAHGALITSATLRDMGGDLAETKELDWRAAEVRVGAHHLPEPPSRALFGSPFDWAKQARIIVVKDLGKRDLDSLAAAYRELFLAAGGGALGLFTAVRVLRAVHARIAAPLADAGLTLFAQHVDALDTGTLVDLFRAEENASLLGTDALRDGVDVVGRSLRLCVFDKVPWPKPSILHRARRERFGKTYDDSIARLRLKQAFGRLIRSESDKGVFVLLDAACPSRLLAALPPEAPILRCGLKQAVEETQSFLATNACYEPS